MRRLLLLVGRVAVQNRFEVSVVYGPLRSRAWRRGAGMRAMTMSRLTATIHSRHPLVLAGPTLLLLALGLTMTSGAGLTLSSGDPASFDAGSLQLASSRPGRSVLSAASMTPGESRIGTIEITDVGDVPGSVSLRVADLVDSPPGSSLSSVLRLTVIDLTGGQGERSLERQSALARGQPRRPLRRGPGADLPPHPHLAERGRRLEPAGRLHLVRLRMGRHRRRALTAAAFLRAGAGSSRPQRCPERSRAASASRAIATAWPASRQGTPKRPAASTIFSIAASR
jgi:hypothetical protein